MHLYSVLKFTAEDEDLLLNFMLQRLTTAQYQCCHACYHCLLVIIYAVIYAWTFSDRYLARYYIDSQVS